MKLAIFDLDGTLTDTNDVDTACFIAAWRDAHDIDCSDLSWSSFQHVTDRGVAETLCERLFETEERERGYASVKSAFHRLLEDAIRERPETCRPIAGALEVLEFLKSRGWRAVIATGAWADSARIKLAAAGFPQSTPVASCDLHASRSAIVRSAISLAGQTYGCEFERRVLIGDAAWDVTTAAEVGLPFVGRASGPAGRKLREVGAGRVLDDFTDLAAVEDALGAATVPLC